MLSRVMMTSDCPANLPALFTETRWPVTSYPEGMAISPSTDNGESSVAWNVCPDWFFSESIVSTKRIAKVVPDEIVTFCGGGGGSGCTGAAGVAEGEGA